MKCSKCGTEYSADPAFVSEWMQINGQNREHTDAMCRDLLAERLAWFREMPAAIRLERAELVEALRAERALRKALSRDISDQLQTERARSAALMAEVDAVRREIWELKYARLSKTQPCIGCSRVDGGHDPGCKA
jgi:hypothetical protein